MRVQILYEGAAGRVRRRYMKLVSSTVMTPDGMFHMIMDDHEVVRASGFGPLEELVKRLPGELQSSTIEPETDHAYADLVKAYYDGDTTALDRIPRVQDGSDFQRRVWAAIAAIPFGETRSYKHLANASGNPAAIRAAGTICGLNKLILLVPCHRILKSDGSIGSYLYGPIIKESLLKHEGAIA